MNNSNISKVYLLDVPLENDYKNTLYFANKSAQESYFQSKIIGSYSYNDFTYVRKDRIIRIPELYDNICHCNYIMYQNTNYGNKWFYAFVTDLEYINDGRTDLHIETDVIQTWLFDYNVKSSFVEREHVSDDTIGANTTPENIELGEYVCNDSFGDPNLTNLVYIVQVTEYINGEVPLAVNFGGIYAPGGAYVCKTMSQVTNIIQALNSLSKGDAITNVYTVPSAFVNQTEGELQYPGQEGPMTYNITISKPTTINGYTPKNNKLFTYPYNYLAIDNNNGMCNTYHYELWNGNNCTFEGSGVPTVGGSIKVVPTNYKGIAKFEQEGLIAGKYPICGWINDTYTNWLTQNSVNIGVGIISSGLQMVGGTAMMSNPTTAVSGGSNIMNGALGIANSIGQIYQHAVMPNTARGNTNGGDINTCSNTNRFYYLKMSIKQEYARIVDNYFTMFGYKINRVKVPNKNHRSNYWYTKCLNVNIDGNIPQNDLQKIKDCYNNGITFWKNPSNIEDYSVTNNII